MNTSIFFRQGATQVITIAAGSAACATAFGAFTNHVRLATPAVGVWYKVAPTPTAAITDTYLPPNSVEIISVAPGDKIAVLQPTAPAGTFNITELTH